MAVADRRSFMAAVAAGGLGGAGAAAAAPVLFSEQGRRLMTVPEEAQRSLREERIAADLVVAGGGLSGTCCAITAARQGLRVALIQDRPVLGGNASSEVRLWVLGATAHMGNNNRWAREGGVADEILVENVFRNAEGNPVFFDPLLLEKVVEEENITLLLNTAVFGARMAGPDQIEALRAFNSQNATFYDIRAPLFCDATGDGIVGYLSGAPFRMGAEEASAFGEPFAPDADYGELLGHTIYFYAKDTGQPVPYVAPSFALKDITDIPRRGGFTPSRHGCYYWWLEYGGRMDTVHDTEAIKWELWRVVYGVWDYIKNSGEFPEAETMTLEWAGLIPGKRESRRFEGGYMLTQKDIVEQRNHYDAVAHGGWSIDLHPADGIYSARSGCDQWHAKGVYGIPYRCMYSRGVANLFITGRLISVSHVAFGSTRVMATCAAAGQAAGMAAAVCNETGRTPRELSERERVTELQRRLLREGQYIPGVPLQDAADLCQSADISASSVYELGELPPGGPTLQAGAAWGMLIPARKGPFPRIGLWADAAHDTEAVLTLRASSRLGNYTPDATLATVRVPLAAGGMRRIEADFETTLTEDQYVFVCVEQNPDLSLHTSERRVTGVLAVTYAGMASRGRGDAEALGFDEFEIWPAMRRPAGRNLAMTFSPALRPFAPQDAANGYARPYLRPNAWVASLSDTAPSLTLQWTAPQRIARIVLGFDTDFDHPMESVQWGHPERVMPFCVRAYRIETGEGEAIAACDGNYQTRVVHRLAAPIETAALRIRVDHPSASVPAALFETRCYRDASG